jgi:hypothetical protein
MRMPPAEPFVPMAPPAYAEAKHPDPAAPQMSWATLLAGMGCKQGAQAWRVDDTQAIIAEHGANRTAHSTWVAITKNGRCYHHVTCSVLFCEGGHHRGTAYHKAVVVQRSSELRTYNGTRNEGEGALRSCGFCKKAFQDLLGQQPC